MINKHPSRSVIIRETIAAFRRAMVLLATEDSGLKKRLGQQHIADADDDTFVRLLKAGTVLGLFARSGTDRYSWSQEYEWVLTDDRGWEQLIATIRHQISYLMLIENPEFWQHQRSLSPATQLQMRPTQYRSFLQGVAESHQGHAAWISEIEDLDGCQYMADLGGGLGTYSIAWVSSRRDRKAVIVDLPRVGEFVHEILDSYGGRLTFFGTDLNELAGLPSGPDFVLLANVLHLVSDWQQVLVHVINTVMSGCTIGIFEANPQTPQGVLFDLQVHLRSGRQTHLLDPMDVRQTLLKNGAKNIRRLELSDPDDPFRREYNFWLAET